MTKPKSRIMPLDHCPDIIRIFEDVMKVYEVFKMGV
jgi:hypothetical protein